MMDATITQLIHNRHRLCNMGQLYIGPIIYRAYNGLNHEIRVSDIMPMLRYC